MKFKVGDKVEWTGSSGTGERGTVTHVLGKKFEVTWSDGGCYTYEDWPGGSVRKIGK
ncbi:MAG TPA: hypothetical protein VFA65_24440 [Bryobacteraceae bacterium]|nr:hypothetical protein [Bryobacteraceae bacterium]